MLVRAVALVCFWIPMLAAQPYAASVTNVDGVEVIRLSDEGRKMRVSIAPSIGANAYELLVNGKNALHFPYESLAAFQAAPRLTGVPLLWPWANRLDQDGFHFDGRFYGLQEGLAPFRRDGSKLPIHGLLAFSDAWEIVNVSADERDAEAVLRLRFERYPELIALFPFAHSIALYYALTGGALVVTTRIDNHSARRMPVSLGFHPYFQVHDAPRDAWTVELAAASVWKLNAQLIPTGEKVPSEELFPDRKKMGLKGSKLDNVFGDLERGSGDWATFVLRGEREQVAVDFGPGYDVAVVYAPGGDRGGFVCFEPMAGVTNAINLAHQGRYPDLQSIDPGASWTATFRIRPTGF